MAEPVKGRTLGIILGAAVVVALGGGWAANAAGVFDRPAPEPTAVIQEETTPTPTVTPTPTPTPTVEAVVEEPPAPTEDTPEETVINDDGTVSGPGCPPPYVDLGYGCQDPICGVDENGNDIPCN